MTLAGWMREMKGRTVVVETDDDELTGELEDVADEEHWLSLRLKSATNCNDDEYGPTVITWKSGYRISLVESG